MRSRVRIAAAARSVRQATGSTQVHAVLAKLEVTSQLEAVAMYRRARR